MPCGGRTRPTRTRKVSEKGAYLRGRRAGLNTQDKHKSETGLSLNLPENRNLDQIPQLAPLAYGSPYCEECRDVLQPGWLVAWWRVKDASGRWRKAVLCAACHRDRVRIRRLPRAAVRDDHRELNDAAGDAGAARRPEAGVSEGSIRRRRCARLALARPSHGRATRLSMRDRGRPQTPRVGGRE